MCQLKKILFLSIGPDASSFRDPLNRTGTPPSIHVHAAWHSGVDGSRLSLLVERRTRDRKVASSSPDRNGGRLFFSRVNFLCWLLLGVPSTPCYRRGM